MIFASKKFIARSLTAPGYAAQLREASIRRFRISVSCFLDNQVGHEQTEPTAVLVPPLGGKLLMRSDHQITAPTCSQITNDSRFQVDLRFRHELSPASPALAPGTTCKSLP